MFRRLKPVKTGHGHLLEMQRAEWIGANRAVDQIFFSVLTPGAVSAWHAHSETTDRLCAAEGSLLVVIFDNRDGSPTQGRIAEFRLSPEQPGLLVVPPRLWHGVKNVGADNACLVNAVDHAYCYEAPDHWRVAPDSPQIPYRIVT